jgi:hypothetical protein
MLHSAGMTRPQQAAGNWTHRDQIQCNPARPSKKIFLVFFLRPVIALPFDILVIKISEPHFAMMLQNLETGRAWGAELRGFPGWPRL